MADALISPLVGCSTWVISVGLIGYSSKKTSEELDELNKIPLMGILGAFVFASQMINFTIPGTGSSGHLGGGMLLAILLTPYPAFLTMASILIVQALFFADGGLLALGCNILNLGFFPCFIAYPFIFRKIIQNINQKSLFIAASIISAIIAIQLGALSVVIQTFLSGKSELPFGPFLLLMQPIHLAIGLIEGIITASVILFIQKARPDIITDIAFTKSPKQLSLSKLFIILLICTVLLGGIASWFTSTHPDGLEWSLLKTTGKEELELPQKGIHHPLANIQEKTALLPDYALKKEKDTNTLKTNDSWPVVNTGTTLSGILGSLITLSIAISIGFLLRLRKKFNSKFNTE